MRRADHAWTMMAMTRYAYHIKSVASGRLIQISGAVDAKASSLVSWVEADPGGRIRLDGTNGFAFDPE